MNIILFVALLNYMCFHIFFVFLLRPPDLDLDLDLVLVFPPLFDLDLDLPPLLDLLLLRPPIEAGVEGVNVPSNPGVDVVTVSIPELGCVISSPSNPPYR
jgi:hypothetical protein